MTNTVTFAGVFAVLFGIGTLRKAFLYQVHDPIRRVWLRYALQIHNQILRNRRDWAKILIRHY